jgi:hypothetical protein
MSVLRNRVSELVKELVNPETNGTALNESYVVLSKRVARLESDMELLIAIMDDDAKPKPKKKRTRRTEKVIRETLPEITVTNARVIKVNAKKSEHSPLMVHILFNGEQYYFALPKAIQSNRLRPDCHVSFVGNVEGKKILSIRQYEMVEG